MRQEGAVLIIAASGRALAASARRGGFVPLVADWFADQDMTALAESHVHLADGLSRGMQADALDGALEMLAAGRLPCGVVCGTGFEDRPALLAAIAARWRLLGNGADVVAQVKDPLGFAALCRTAEIAHPDTAEAVGDGEGWLVKRRGGSGGAHVGPADEQTSSRTYAQRRVDGAAVSALFLADGRDAMVLGFSAQWAAPAPGRPFRYGGAVQPAALAPELRDELTDAVRRLVTLVPLRGLNSADFLVDGPRFWLLEINPRPGATLDLFEPEDGSLFAAHLDACAGRLRAPPAPADARAATIVYATHDIVAVPALDWPAWTTDRPHAGTAIPAGAPLCTVHAAAATASDARRLVDERHAAILSLAQRRAA